MLTAPCGGTSDKDSVPVKHESGVTSRTPFLEPLERFDCRHVRDVALSSRSRLCVAEPRTAAGEEVGSENGRSITAGKEL